MKIHRSSLLLVSLLYASVSSGEVTRLEIQKREPYAGGKVFGERGSYEKLTGVAHFELDELYKESHRVRDLLLADMTPERKVEFWADFEILAPKDLTKANGALLYEVNNRGNKTAPGIFDGGADDFLLRQGFIVVWSGWIAEVLPEEGKFKMWAPTAKEDDRPLKGVVRQEVIVDKETPKACLAHRGRQGSYRPTAAGLTKATLTVREREGDPRKAVPEGDWKLIVTDVSYQYKPWPLPVVELEIQGGLKAGRIYEVVYEAEGSVLQGVGLAGIRDLVAFLKYYGLTKSNPLAVDGKSVATRAYGFGTSQSGRCLRQFLHDGFNTDEFGAKVFDGIISHVAGGGLGSFNHRFASPTRTNGQHDEHDFPADYFPFTYGDSRDPFTEKTDGILSHTRGVDVPKVFHTQSSSEYWHRSGSLVHTDPLGKEDAVIPPNVRLYTFGGCQHGAGSGVPGPRGAGQLPASPADYRPLMRALLMALDAWVKDGTEPPPSVYPRIADGTLVPWQQDKSGWPAIPGVNYPQVIQQPNFLYRGPEWQSKMIATVEPPEVRGHYIVRVPGYGPDGNEKGTLLLPAVQVPVATYASWNLRNASIGAEGELLSLQGGFIPFPHSKEDRAATKDPRPALLERYRDFADYEQQYMAAAEKLVAARYLLAEDLPRLKALCAKFRGEFELK